MRGEEKQEMELEIQDKKSPQHLRVCSFNINGLNTLFNYHPWSRLKTLDLAFEYLKCDIITFQELKISKITSNAVLKNYKTFITIPKLKKGYSGVGVYIRQVKDDENNDFLKKLLTVRKVEEGLTGNLPLPLNKKLTYRDAKREYTDEVIGGYPTAIQDVALDHEGRCILVELNYNIVIISLYCPANSLGTEDMEQFRINFLRLLIERCYNLIALGKEVIVMGDINVSRDLIDSDEYIREGIKLDCIKKVVGVEELQSQDGLGEKFEILNKKLAIEFRELTELKRIVNSVIYDSYFSDNFGTVIPNPIFIDLLRKSQQRRLRMYTCWNTLKNARPSNSGSRIDHIWATPRLAGQSLAADIWNHLMGSDHCPVHCDLDLTKFVDESDTDIAEPRKLKFEASSYYGVDNGGNSIDKFFGRHTLMLVSNSEPVEKRKLTSDSSTPSSDGEIKSKPVYVSRKKRKNVDLKTGQLGINNFFFKPASKIEPEEDCSNSASPQSSQVSINEFANLLQSTKSGSPNCEHNEPAILRTSTKPLTKGKKFWCCSRTVPLPSDYTSDKDQSQQNEDRCDYFKWASK